MAPHDDAHDSDGSNLRRIGLTFAALAALTAIAVVVWATAFSAPSGNTPGETVSPLDEPRFTPFEEGSVAAAPETEDIQDLVKNAEDAELQFFDAEDESLRGKMTFARLDPQPNGRFFAESPEAWLLMNNDTSARITSRETTFRMPAGSGEPESGRFVGDVRIELHPGRLEDEDAQKASQPFVVFSMDELHFDAALGQIRTASEVSVDARGIEGVFAGLEAVIDEPARRLSHLSTRGGGWLRQTDPAGDVLGDDDGEGGDPAGAGEQRIDHYRAIIDGGVRIENDGRVVTSDQLEVWARLVDGGLPADAIASFLTVGGAGDAREGAEPPGAAPQGAMFQWDGRLVVSPLREEPPELERDQLVGRFSSPASGLVEIRDSGSGVEIAGARIAYGATTRRLTMIGSGSTGVSFTAPGTGTLVCGRLEADLSSGDVLMPGAGELRAQTDPGDQRRVARTISWQRQARLGLETMGGHIDLSGRWPLRTATFQGGATAREGEAEIAGEQITAAFKRDERGVGKLTRVVVEGEARATAPDAGEGRAGRLLGERLTVDFSSRSGAEGDERITPTSVLVEGRALAERGAEGIEAEILRARLGRDPTTDELRIESLEAELDVLVRGIGGEEAVAESVKADPLRGIYDLVGEPVVLRSGGAAVRGDSMRIDEIQQRLTVFGSGELTYREPREDAAGYQNVTVAWAGAMTFDGVMERAEFTGDVVVVGEPDDLTRDTLRGERVIVDVAAGEAGSAGGTEAAFKRAQIIGEVEELGAGRAAQIESRRYRVDPASESGLALEFLAYLDGPTLVADAASETLMAPAAGRLLFEDRRGERDGSASQGLSTRGTTLFEWDGAARFDRGRGEAVMTRGVRLRQKARGEQRVTELESERLEAKFALPSGEETTSRFGDDAALGARLKTARASGAVYARQGGRELIADRLEYDTEAGVAQAWANEGNLVTIFDAARPIPVTGSVLRWDLKRDRIEWRDAGATSAPR